MRILTQTAADWISQKVGVEPINILIISWIDGVWNYYVDTDYGELTAAGVSPTLGIDGLILEMSNLESLPNLDGSGSSQSVSVSLDDTEGKLKTIIDTHDIHKRPVKVAQWFKGIPLQDAFVLFEGQISSPIVWSEGKRTLDFDIVSLLESREIGYSIEEGNFDFAPPNLIGKAWPYIMGTAFKVPAIRIQDVPHGVTSAQFRAAGTNRNNTNASAAGNLRAMNDALYNAQVAYSHSTGLKLANPLDRQAPNAFAANAPFIADYTVRTRVDKFGDADVYADVRHVIRGTRQDLERQQIQYFRRGNEYLLQAQEAGQASFGSPQSTSPDTTIALANGSEFPQNTPLTIAIGGRTYSGTVQNNTFHIAGITSNSYIGIAPASQVAVEDDSISTQYLQYIEGAQDFVIAGGHQVFIGNGSGFGVDYIACLDACTVAGVYAKRTFGNVTRVWPVPSNYYSVTYPNFGPNFGTGNPFDDIIITKITMATPLSSRTDGQGNSEGWDDDIFVDLGSPYGANTVDHMKILIQRYTNATWDTTSFDSVSTLQANFPAGAAITQRRDVLTVLQEMAFQMRCNIRYNDGKFYLKYLPIDYPYVANITADDIERSSLEITANPTEDLVTKLVARWKLDHSGEPQTTRTTIYRHNIIRYGTHEKEYDFWLYNIEAIVHKSAVFWMIRKSNTYKKLKFNTFLTKLPLEANDYVNVTLSQSHNGSVIGMVESCIYDSVSSKMTMELWLPVRWGERDKYEYAMPADLPATAIFPTKKAVAQGEAGSGSRAAGALVTKGVQYYNAPPARSPHMDRGGNLEPFNGVIQPTFGFGVSDQGITAPLQYPTFLNPADINRTLDTTNGSAPVPVKAFVVKPVQSPTSIVTQEGTIWPGFVKEQIGPYLYNVDVYKQGLGNSSQSLEVEQIQIHTDDVIDPDTPCIVFSLPIIDADGGTTLKYYMQVPVWAGPSEDS